MSRSSLLRRFTLLSVVIALIVLIPLVVFGPYAIQVVSNRFIQVSLERVKQDVQRDADVLKRVFDIAKSDIPILSELPEMRELVQSRAGTNSREIERATMSVERAFLTFSRHRRIYYRVRYIDEHGWEVVRVDHDGITPPSPVREADLQNKRDSRYFTETMKRGPGQIYTSPMDLNREHGRIETPHRPVIRYAMPIFDDAGNRRGIVIISLAAGPLMEALNDEEKAQQEEMSIIDREGFYMFHHDPKKRWGGPGDLNTGERIQRDFPAMVARVFSSTAEAMVTQDHAVSWQALPLSSNPSGSSLVIIERIPTSVALALAEDLRGNLLMLLGSVSVVAVAGAVLAGRMLARPIVVLQEAAMRIRQGDLHVRVNVTGSHEIAVLGNAFNTMAESLAEARNQLTTKVDELERMQSRLIEAERLRAMGQMAAGVAHDVNNALMGVLGQAQIMRLSLEQGPVAEALRGREGYAELLECLARQELAVKDAAETIRKIREATRRRENELFVPVALDAIVEQVLAITRPRWKDQAEAKGVQITVRTDLAATPPILGNAAELREALTNLLFNAVDAMPQGGTLTIATRQHSLTPALQKGGTGGFEMREPDREGLGWVELAVTDTGVGMSQAVQTRIFEPFFTTKGVRGTGLGLSMVHGIVNGHRGEITVQSAEGQGTTVTLRLPVDRVAAAEGAPAAAPFPLPRSLTLLVIDDDPLLAETLCNLLRMLGHEPVIATSGAEGLQRLTTARFDLVLTDLGMSEMTGWEVAQAIKVSACPLPVILVTGWGDTLGQDQLAGTGVDTILPKPYTISQLQYALSTAYRAHSAGRREPTLG